MCFTVQDAKVSILAERGAKKNRGHQITTTNNGPWGLSVLQRQNER